MSFQKILIPLASLAWLAVAFYLDSWRGLGVASGALVMWLLLHFTRMMQVLRRAGSRPLGSVASAVMLNAKLRPGMSLLHVLALTRALGERTNAPGTPSDCFRWTDGSESFVEAEFLAGRLKKWALTRPIQPEPAANDAGPGSAP